MTKIAKHIIIFFLITNVSSLYAYDSLNISLKFHDSLKHRIKFADNLEIENFHDNNYIYFNGFRNLTDLRSYDNTAVNVGFANDENDFLNASGKIDFKNEFGTKYSMSIKGAVDNDRNNQCEVIIRNLDINKSFSIVTTEFLPVSKTNRFCSLSVDLSKLYKM